MTRWLLRLRRQFPAARPGRLMPAIEAAMAVLMAAAALGAAAAEASRAPVAVLTIGTEAIIVLGAAGEPEFGSNFVQQARLWENACQQAGAGFIQIGGSETNAPADRERLRQQLAATATDALMPLWLVFIGHGTFDGKEARFNVRGPDISVDDMAEWLEPFRRPVVVINTASASAPFLNQLSASNRVIVTATRGGYELNFARFGEHLARTIADPESDLDQDGQTSLLEAFLSAAARVAEFYQTEGRIATEHALVDDNGDALGTPADWFRGVRAIKKPQEGAVDGARAHQIHLVPIPSERALPPEVRQQRDALELELARLRDAKATLDEDDYYRQLESLLLKLARLQIQTKREGR